MLSDGGGHAALAADALSAAKVDLARLSETTRAHVRDLLGPTAAAANPVDVAGMTDADPERFAACARLLAADPSVGLVLIVGLYGGYQLRFDLALREAEERAARQLVEIVDATTVPLLVHSCYAVDQPETHAILRRGGISVFGSIDHAVRAVTALVRRGRYLATLDQRSDLFLPSFPDRHMTGPASLLDEAQGRRVLELAGLDTGRWELARTADQAKAAVLSFGQPCALKIVSPHIAHKSDVGGVRLDVTPAAAPSTYAEFTTSVAKARPDARITGVIVTPMAEPGVELFLGAIIDPTFGPVLAFGSGGTLLEARQDVAFRAAPITAIEAREMIAETIVSRQLAGYRSLPAVDVGQLAAFIVRLGDIATRIPRLQEIDLNPVIMRGSVLSLVDVRVVLAAKPETANSE